MSQTPQGISCDRYDARYLAYFECFNRQEFFEAHEVLEGLWLATHDERRNFYKGLIQTAAALLKVKTGKPDPARRLAARAHALLQPYAPRYQGLDVAGVLQLLAEIQANPHSLTAGAWPQLRCA
ncbi:MAG: DUF309 domain-containing protein [Verrucomicrobiae bacterium]|nr:DUF309 domain-containing protein [Verrucomicrobiae bacterium]